MGRRLGGRGEVTHTGSQHGLKPRPLASSLACFLPDLPPLGSPRSGTAFQIGAAGGAPHDRSLGLTRLPTMVGLWRRVKQDCTAWPSSAFPSGRFHQRALSCFRGSVHPSPQ